MNAKEFKKIINNLTEAIELLRNLDCEFDKTDAIIKKGLDREAALLNENEKLNQQIQEALESNNRLFDSLKTVEEGYNRLFDELKKVEHRAAELEAELAARGKYRECYKKPANEPKKGFRIKED